MFYFYNIVIGEVKWNSENTIIKMVKICYLVGIIYSEIPLLSNSFISTSEFGAYIDMDALIGKVHLGIIIFLFLSTTIF